MKSILNKQTILLAILIIIFFSFSLILTYDSGHYLGYIDILDRKEAFANWDIARGPIFPIIIFLSNHLFGRTATGMLICLFLFYLTFIIICYLFIKKIANTYQHKTLICSIILLIVTINPLIFGYFHVLLTEFVAITITMLNILMAYKWLSIDTHSRKQSILYTVYFVVSLIFCYHLKQPYIIIAATPPIIATIISIINNHQRRNVLIRLSTVAIAFVCFLISLTTWNIIIDTKVQTSNDRSSSSLLNRQLVYTYQISESDYQAESSSLKIMLNSFSRNPGKMIGTYFKNYCGLSSLCKVESKNGVDYIATSKLEPLETFENSIIGYATFYRTDNIFQMSEDMRERAESYAMPVANNIFSIPMKLLTKPTNLLFKISIIICPAILIFLLIIRFKYKAKAHRYKTLFNLNLLLLGTASLHLIFSAFAMVIDRYAVEAFAPTLIGLFGTITYSKLVIEISKNKTTKN